jgi:hypothetical protein
LRIFSRETRTGLNPRYPLSRSSFLLTVITLVILLVGWIPSLIYRHFSDVWSGLTSEEGIITLSFLAFAAICAILVVVMRRVDYHFYHEDYFRMVADHYLIDLMKDHPLIEEEEQRDIRKRYIQYRKDVGDWSLREPDPPKGWTPEDDLSYLDGFESQRPKLEDYNLIKPSRGYYQ